MITFTVRLVAAFTLLLSGNLWSWVVGLLLLLPIWALFNSRKPMNYDTNPNPFARATAQWRAEVDRVAADLLGRGEACSPAEAAAQAERMVQERRRADAEHASDLAKRFEGGGPIIGGHGV